MQAQIPNNVLLQIVNGDHFTGSFEGEDFGRAVKPGYLVPMRIAGRQGFNPDNWQRIQIQPNDLAVFIRDQVSVLMSVQPPLQDKEIAVCSYLRLFAVQEGLISDAYEAKAHNVNYNDAVRCVNNAAVINAIGANNVGVADDATLNRIMATVNEGELRKIAENFFNMVCMVAFFFRVRGHHYVDELEGRYANLWARCRMQDFAQPVAAKVWTTYGLHAIMPDVLDAAWNHARRAAMIAGALSKRYDCAAAGMAGIVVVKAGVDDLVMVAPGLRTNLDEAMNYLDEMANRLRGNRWYGSINARYYGAPHATIDEKKLAAIASAVYAVLATVAPESDLNKSAALKRIARGAPITGAILGRAAARISEAPEVVASLVSGGRHEIPEG